MELRLDHVASALKQLEEALGAFNDAQADIEALEQYYNSDDWRHDFESDEAGELPAELKRGVLSEDAVWNLLDDCKELGRRLGVQS